MTKYYIGIDLHSDNLYVGVMDQNGKRRFRAKLSCEMEEILETLNRFKRFVKVIIVERFRTFLSQCVQCATPEPRSKPIASKSIGHGPVIGSLSESMTAACHERIEGWV